MPDRSKADRPNKAWYGPLELCLDLSFRPGPHTQAVMLAETMQLLRCTVKLQKAMKIAESDLVDEGVGSSLLGQWHSNLLHINRRNCILFVNDKTLFNFIVPDTSVERIHTLADMFRLYLSPVLSEEGISGNLVKRTLEEYQTVAYGKTNNRQILGNMNDLAFQYEVRITKAGSVYSPEVPAIIHQLNRMPMKKGKGYIFPADELRSLYQEAR